MTFLKKINPRTKKFFKKFRLKSFFLFVFNFDEFCRLHKKICSKIVSKPILEKKVGKLVRKFMKNFVSRFLKFQQGGKSFFWVANFSKLISKPILNKRLLEPSLIVLTAFYPFVPKSKVGKKVFRRLNQKFVQNLFQNRFWKKSQKFFAENPRKLLVS